MMKSLNRTVTSGKTDLILIFLLVVVTLVFYWSFTLKDGIGCQCSKCRNGCGHNHSMMYEGNRFK